MHTTLRLLFSGCGLLSPTCLSPNGSLRSQRMGDPFLLCEVVEGQVKGVLVYSLEFHDRLPSTEVNERWKGREKEEEG